MMQQARASRAQLPQSVLDFICERCGGLLVPSVSADVRVVPQSRQAAANRRLARQQRRAQQQNGSNGPRTVRESLVNIVVRSGTVESMELAKALIVLCFPFARG
jgi:hypothetical protein